MKLSDLCTYDLRLAVVALKLERSRLLSMAFGDLEQRYLDYADSLTTVINLLVSEIIERGVDDLI